jgi:hypothetical protein
MERHRFRLLTAAVALAMAGVLGAATEVDITGNWFGLFLLHGKRDALLTLKDDLLLGDGSRLIAGVSFAPARRLLATSPSSRALPRLEVEWSEVDGKGLVRNLFADGSELLTFFSRYEDDDGNEPRGLFVGGALPEVAATPAQDESGMSFRDAHGWHHVWCNVNEVLQDASNQANWPPGKWTFLGSRLLLADRERVVIESSHAIPFASGLLRVNRYAHFHAGQPFFKLGLRFENEGDRPVRFAYGYGDEPWVGHFGSSAGNVGFLPGRIVRVEGPVDPKNRWAGILDEESGVAAFLAWLGDVGPDRLYFSNEPAYRFPRLGQPLDSNEVFIGMEWLHQTLGPGEGRTISLSVGMARAGPGEVPVPPPAALP